jgi:4-oxalmesaconate hydratase
MIIDCHGHYTTAPEPHNLGARPRSRPSLAHEPAPDYPGISDDEIVETIEKNQLRLLRERGAT